MGEAITANSITFSATSSGYIIESNTLDLTGEDNPVGRFAHKRDPRSPQRLLQPLGGCCDQYRLSGDDLRTDKRYRSTRVCTVPSADGGSDKAGLTLGGTTTGNTVSQVKYYGNRRYGAITKKGSGSWRVGNVVIGTVNINDGDLIANGEIETKYQGLKLNVGATLHYNNEGAVKGGSFNFLGGSLDNTSGAAIKTSLYNPHLAGRATGPS